jgi:hypothetical protein
MDMELEGTGFYTGKHFFLTSSDTHFALHHDGMVLILITLVF